jgi:hypothetical protein
MLLPSGNELGGSSARCLEGVENFASDVALDASHDFVFGFAFGEAAGDVVTGGLVAAHAHDGTDYLMQTSYSSFGFSGPEGGPEWLTGWNTANGRITAPARGTVRVT